MATSLVWATAAERWPAGGVSTTWGGKPSWARLSVVQGGAACTARGRGGPQGKGRAARLAETETRGKPRRPGGPGPELPPAGAISRTPGCAGDGKDRLEEEGVAAGAGGAVRSVRKLSGRDTRRWRSQGL